MPLRNAILLVVTVVSASAPLGWCGNGRAATAQTPPGQPVAVPPPSSPSPVSTPTSTSNSKAKAPADAIEVVNPPPIQIDLVEDLDGTSQTPGAAVTKSGDEKKASEPRLSADMRSGPIDLLEQKILHDRTRRIVPLQKMQAAINRGDFTGAITAAKSLQNRSDYQDYFHYLSGRAQAGRMRKFQTKRQWANAILSGEQAAFHFSQVQSANPYTTLEKRAGALLGEIEATMGDINLKMRRPIKARDLYEKGFQRLSHGNYLGLISKSTIISYALLCERRKTDICVGWLDRLAPFVAKEDARLLERVGHIQKPYIEKTAAPVSYKVDMDLKAFEKGLQPYLEGKYDEAFVAWSQLLKDYPRTSIKLRTKFWMGRAAQKSNHDAHAETLYREIIAENPFTYYSLLASWFGGIDLSRMIDAAIPIASTEASALSPFDMVHIRRAETFIASGVPELANLELQNIRANSNMANEFLVYLATLNHMAGSHLAAFQIASELSNRGYKGLYSRYGQTILFPTEALSLIEKIGKEIKVDPLIVLSVIKQESAFNPQAVSGAQAYGLMQLISPTARDLDPDVQMVDLFTPAKNIRLGVKYISQLLAKYKGNIVPVLAAYNAGPKHSDRWLRESQQFAAEEYIEQITFRETREYIQNVLRNYYWYSRTVRKEAFPTLGALLQSVQANVGHGGHVSQKGVMGPPLYIDVPGGKN